MGDVAKSRRRSVLVPRWIARLWSLVVLYVAVSIAVTPDPYATGEPIPLGDQYLLGLWGLAVLGLLIAWRWEPVGAAITIGAMVLREVSWLVIYRYWMVNFLLVWAGVIPPALLFLVAWWQERKSG